MIVRPTCLYNIHYEDYGNSSKFLCDWNHVLPPFKRNGQTIGFINVMITFNSFSSTCISSWWHDIIPKIGFTSCIKLNNKLLFAIFWDFSWLLVFVTIRKEKVKNLYFSFCMQNIPVFFKKAYSSCCSLPATCTWANRFIFLSSIILF